ncbi:hypothetical protein AVEN_211864-1, partial [Araneus ventricosus]
TLRRLRRAILTSGVVLIHNSARPHSDVVTQKLLQQFKALFQRRALTNLESLEVRTCGLWSVEFEQSRHSYGAWLCKYLGSARVNRCNGAVWSL